MNIETKSFISLQFTQAVKYFEKLFLNSLSITIPLFFSSYQDSAL